MDDEPVSELAQAHRLAVRFGSYELLEDGVTSVPNLLLAHYATLGISSAEMMFCVHIWQRCWTEGDPCPALQSIAERMGVSRRQVRTYVQSLRRKGYLSIVERSDPSLGRLTNEYQFAPLFEAALFVRSLWTKLDPLVTPRQRRALALALQRLFGGGDLAPMHDAIAALVDQLRSSAPSAADLLQEEIASLLKRRRSQTGPGRERSFP